MPKLFPLSRVAAIALAIAATTLTGLAPYVSISAQAPSNRATTGTSANAPAAVAARGAGAGSAAASSGSAAASAGSTPVFDVAARRAVIDTITQLLERHYVDADTGKLIARMLSNLAKTGAYDAIDDPYRFAEMVTADLRSVNGDKHLMVQYDPARTAARPGPEGIRMRAGPGEQPPRREFPPEVIARNRRVNFALGRAEVLAGNIGYLEIRGFNGMEEAKGAVIDALRYLQYTDAMIFDLRRNGGGSAELVNFIISHFTGPDTLASLTVTNRSGGEKFTRYTLATVPGPRRTDVPLYVLTSGFTASAGEDFCFVLKNLGRATIVGQPTAGAGHNNALLDAGHGFAVSVSFTRVADPKTGAEWERIGVQPDVKVDQADALLAAQSLALKAIESKAGSDTARKQTLAAIAEAVDAQLHPHHVAAKKLASYAGEYEGGRTVSVVGDKLAFSSRAGAPAEPLVALSDSLFALGERRISFARTRDGAMQMTLAAPGDGTLTYSRVARDEAR